MDFSSLRIVLGKRGGDEGGHDAPSALAGMRQRVAHEMDAATLPAGIKDLADRIEDSASDLDMVFDLVDGETRERSWGLAKKGGVLVTTLTEPSSEKAGQFGVRALRYTVEADGDELAEIAELVTSGKVEPHVQKTFPLGSAADALASVENGHSVGKMVLKVA